MSIHYIRKALSDKLPFHLIHLKIHIKYEINSFNLKPVIAGKLAYIGDLILFSDCNSDTETANVA